MLQNAIAYTDRKGRITLTADGDKEQRGDPHHATTAPASRPRTCRGCSTASTGCVEAGVRGEAALGLGLPLTRQFIEAHGGTVELQSKKGKGTTVTLTIPRGSK